MANRKLILQQVSLTAAVAISIGVFLIFRSTTIEQAESATERLHRITETFYSDDSILFNAWYPNFEWEDIPALLEIAKSEKIVEGMPSLVASSYAGQSCREGMIALWLIEGIRRRQLSKQIEKQVGEKMQMALAYSRLPLNPICIKEGINISECEQSLEIYELVLQAYRNWWQTFGSLSASEASAFYPLDLTDIEWFGSPDRWPQEPLEIFENISTDGIAAERTIRQLQKIEDSYDYEPNRIMQKVYYTLVKPSEKAPFNPDMLKIQKIELWYYDQQGKVTRTEEIFSPKINRISDNV